MTTKSFVGRDFCLKYQAFKTSVFHLSLEVIMWVHDRHISTFGFILY